MDPFLLKKKKKKNLPNMCHFIGSQTYTVGSLLFAASSSV